MKGSHIVVPRVHAEAHAYILQNADNRIVFVIPYQDRYSLIGTTDVPVDDYERPDDLRRRDRLSAGARQRAISSAPLARSDIVWTYSGVRPLYDDGSTDPSAVTRDYVLKVDALGGRAGRGRAPVLSIFGGKITTYRKLAEHALAELAPFFPAMKAPWTRDADAAGRRPAGPAIAPRGSRELVRALSAAAGRRCCARSRAATARARCACSAMRRAPADLGEDFGAELTAREVDYLVARGMGAHGRRRAVAADQVRPADDAGAQRARVAARRRARGTRA